MVAKRSGKIRGFRQMPTSRIVLMETSSVYTDPEDSQSLMDDVVARKLRVNRDPRGVLVETLRSDWADCFDESAWPFAQTYYSVTEPWVARDEDRWHVHQHQCDRFVIPGGNVVLALFDQRGGSRTVNRLNLLRLGESNGDTSQWLVLIPPGVLHGFMAIGPDKALLLNYPTRLFDPSDEGRLPYDEVGARLADGRAFTWDLVRAVERSAVHPPSR